MNFSSLHIDALRQLFQHLPDVYFFAKDINGRFIMANSTFVEKCRARIESEIIGKTDHDFFPHDRADIYIKDDHYVMSTGQSIINKVELAPEPDNSMNWFITSKVPLRAHDGRIIGLAGIARDLSKAITSLTPYSEMSNVLKYIDEHFADEIEIHILAEMMHLSVSQFERKFKKTFQLSPVKHITNVRINAAKQLLSTTNKKVSSIAQDTGFYDHSHLTREFIRHTGMTPTQYRKKMG